MAEAYASGIRLNGMAESCIGNEGLTPMAHGSAYPQMKGVAPSPVPHAIQRSCRRAVIERTSASARVSANRPAAKQPTR